MLYLTCCVHLSFAQQWNHMGNGLGISGYGAGTGVECIVQHDNDIYVGGMFIDGEGIPDADNLARWDGCTWHAVAPGIDGSLGGVVFDISFSGSDMYVGGHFTAPFNNIARWDGSQWYPLGSGPGGYVWSIAIDGGNLYAACNGTGIINFVSVWDGSSWSQLGPDFTEYCRRLILHNGELYAGGSFDDVDGNPDADGIVRWDGNAWQNLGSGVQGYVHDMLSYNGELYIGGIFENAGGNPGADNVAVWNGTEWNNLGNGPGNEFGLGPIAIYDDALFVGVGDGWNPPVGIMRWDFAEQNWEMFQEIMTIEEENEEWATVLKAYGNDLYVGTTGTNMTINGEDYGSIARYGEPSNVVDVSAIIDTVCTNDLPIPLPTNIDGYTGNWSGLGISNNIFNPTLQCGVIPIIFDPNGQCVEGDTTSMTVVNLESSNLNSTCDDNGTSNDASDDFILLDLNVQGCYIGSSYSVSVSTGTINPGTGIYGGWSEFQLQPGSAGNGDVVLTITDEAEPDCSFEFLIDDPGICSMALDCPYAGVDTTFTYFPFPAQWIDLLEFIGGDSGGTWDPPLSSGTNIYSPCDDGPGEFTYTIDSAGCPTSTATVTLEWLWDPCEWSLEDECVLETGEVSFTIPAFPGPHPDVTYSVAGCDPYFIIAENLDLDSSYTLIGDCGSCLIIQIWFPFPLPPELLPVAPGWDLAWIYLADFECGFPNCSEECPEGTDTVIYLDSYTIYLRPVPVEEVLTFFDLPLDGTWEPPLQNDGFYDYCADDGSVYSYVESIPNCPEVLHTVDFEFLWDPCNWLIEDICYGNDSIYVTIPPFTGGPPGTTYTLEVFSFTFSSLSIDSTYEFVLAAFKGQCLGLLVHLNDNANWYWGLGGDWLADTYFICPIPSCNCSDPPYAGEDNSITICPDTISFDLTNALGGDPDEGGTWTPPLNSGGNIYDPDLDGTGTFIYTVSADECPDDMASVEVSVVDLSQSTIDVSCFDNNTPSDDTDDIILIDVTPVGSYAGTSYTVNVSSGSISPGSGSYGVTTSFQMQPGSAGSGNVLLTITDNAPPFCNFEFVIADQGPCSIPPCSEPSDTIIYADSVTWIGNLLSTTLVNVDSLLNAYDIPLGGSWEPPLGDPSMYDFCTEVASVYTYSESVTGCTTVEHTVDFDLMWNICTWLLTDLCEANDSVYMTIPAWTNGPPGSTYLLIITLDGIWGEFPGLDIDSSYVFAIPNPNSYDCIGVDIYLNGFDTWWGLGGEYFESTFHHCEFPECNCSDPPYAGDDNSLTICSDTLPFDLTNALGGNPDEGGTWSPPLNSGGNTFDPVLDGTGTYIYTVSADGCPDDMASVDVIVVNLSQSIINVSCFDNNTTSDNTDDIILIDITPVGSHTGTSYTVDVSSGSISPGSGLYGATSSFQMQPGSAGGGDVLLTITDNANPFCSFDFLIDDPGPCSDDCPDGQSYTFETCPYWNHYNNFVPGFGLPLDGTFEPPLADPFQLAYNSCTDSASAYIYENAQPGCEVVYDTAYFDLIWNPCGWQLESICYTEDSIIFTIPPYSGYADFTTYMIEVPGEFSWEYLPGTYSLDSAYTVSIPLPSWFDGSCIGINVQVGNCWWSFAELFAWDIWCEYILPCGACTDPPYAGEDNDISVCSNSPPFVLTDALGGDPDEDGTWSPPLTSGGNIYDPVADGTGVYTYTVSGIGCPDDAASVTVTVTNAFVPLITGVPASLCEEDDAIALPVIQNGVTGNWSGSGVINNMFDPEGLDGIISLTFAPNPGQCALEASADILIISVTIPEITGIPEILCATSLPIALPVMQGGIIGNWSGPGVSNNTFDPQGLSGVINLLFTPNSGQCAISATHDITVQSEITYSITGIPSSLCETENELLLPTTQDGITGNWSGTGVLNNVFDPTGLSGTVTLTFTPDPGQCADNSTIDVEVTSGIEVMISGVPDALCDDAEPIVLPDIQGVISGNWSGAGINNNAFNPAGLNGNITLTFTPEPGQCAVPAMFIVYVNTPPAFTSLAAICDSISQSYVVSFNISGGDPASYTVDGIAINGTSFASSPINADSLHYIFLLDDGNGCGPVEVEGMINCACATFAGTMDFTGAPLKICEGQGFDVTHLGNAVLDPDDVLVFVLHDEAGATLGTIIAMSDDGVFTFPAGIEFGEQYYISAVAASSNGSGEIDLGDECLSVSQGIPVIFLQNVVTLLQPSICPGHFIVVNGNVYDENNLSGTEILSGGASNGCDSIVMVQLSYLPVAESFFTALLCPEESIEINGTFYDIENPVGTEILPGITAEGCDSLVHVSIAFYDRTINYLRDTLCSDESIVVNGTTYDVDRPIGVMVIQGAAAHGCDSIVDIVLTFTESVVIDYQDTLCAGESIAINGTVYDQSNSSDTLVFASEVCDSLVYIELSFYPPVMAGLQQTLCYGSSLVVNGTVYDASNPDGTEVLIGASMHGCDSTVNVSLTFDSVLTEYISPVLCPEESFILNDTIYNEQHPSGSQILQSNGGCDSIIYVDLSFYPESVGYYIDTLLPGESVLINGMLYDATNPNGTEILEGASINGCDSTLHIALHFLQLPLSALIDFAQPECYGDSNGSITVIDVMGGSSPYHVRISNGMQQTISSFPFIQQGLSSGNYQIEIEDSGGSSIEIEITIPEPPLLTVDAGQDQTVVKGEDGILTATALFDVYTWLWTPDDYLTCTDCPDPLVIKPDMDILYTVAATDSNGCTVFDDVLISLEYDQEIFVPALFSPNGDGINDVLTVFANPAVQRIRSMRFFSRWGELVSEQVDFAPNDPGFGWDGTYKGKMLDPGVFVWAAEIEFRDGEIKMFSGDVTLVR